MDLDEFKTINDTHGHAVGDAVLIAAGKAITEAARSTDAVARIGGDEFVVAVGDAASSDLLDELVDRIHGALENAEDRIDRPVQIRASIGTAEVQAGDSFDSLLSRADLSMYQAKRANRHSSEGPTAATQPSR